ncbi:MAG: mitofilin family membrane protein [Parvibaculum sp.]|uniref:COG4223 family protein n=1 Tax=Parvibaculum sp. TaxID=2024848 RepID=UPI00271D8A52|nr:mitofilin family membrane protein [Parvibaculum sp.]MDO8837656.1 mitofilin family membrane protein [Parvibaculum sp.]MDP1625569.1 mitofilin family membrane protein [Parvibaculum sp.]
MTDSNDADAGKGPEPEILKPDAEARRRNEKPRKEPRTLEGTAEEVRGESSAEAQTSGAETRRQALDGGASAGGLAFAAAAGFGGAAVALVAAWILGFGAPAIDTATDERLADLTARIAATEISNGDSADSIDVRVQALAARLDATEAKVIAAETAAPDAQLGRLAEEQQLLKEALDDTRRMARVTQDRIDALAAGLPPAGIADHVGSLDVLVKALDARLATLAPQIETMEARVVLLEEKKDDPDAAARAALGLALANLARVAETAGPFAAELDAVASFLPDEPGLTSLSDAAASGVATRAALKARFPSVVEGIFDAERRAGDEGLWSRFVANAKSLVTIRRTGEISGETTEAIVARMEERLKIDDLAAAAAEGNLLQGPARVAAAAWLEDAQARLETETLLRDLSARVATQLSQSGG